MTKAYRVYFNPTNDDDENYLVDHSIIAYLLNPQGVRACPPPAPRTSRRGAGTRWWY